MSGIEGKKMELASDQDAVLQVLYANFGCFALLTARKLQIFKLFETESLTTAEAADRLGMPNRPIEILLTTLAAHRFLTKSGNRFALEALARTYLLESSLTYLGEMSCNRGDQWLGKGRLAREIDVLGGIIVRPAIDSAGIQFRILNRSRAPRGVRSDWVAVQHERGVSASSTAMGFEHDGLAVNLLDTSYHQVQRRHLSV
jgi:hypothetical protein